MPEPDPLSDAISRVQALFIEGDVAGAQARYQAMWDEAEQHGDCYQACVVAHFMAHAQQDTEDQLLWHLRALAAAEASPDDRVASFYPSLYANVAEVYLRLGNVAEARRYCAHAAAVADRLPGDIYGYIIRGLIARIQQSME